MATTTAPLAPSGSMIRQKICQAEAPSIFAASSSSRGIVEKIPRMMKTLTGRYQPV